VYIRFEVFTAGNDISVVFGDDMSLSLVGSASVLEELVISIFRVEE
jgi:hypothetical protein